MLLERPSNGWLNLTALLHLRLCGGLVWACCLPGPSSLERGTCSGCLRAFWLRGYRGLGDERLNARSQIAVLSEFIAIRLASVRASW